MVPSLKSLLGWWMMNAGRLIILLEHWTHRLRLDILDITKLIFIGTVSHKFRINKWIEWSTSSVCLQQKARRRTCHRPTYSPLLLHKSTIFPLFLEGGGGANLSTCTYIVDPRERTRYSALNVEQFIVVDCQLVKVFFQLSFWKMIVILELLAEMEEKSTCYSINRSIPNTTGWFLFVYVN